MKFLALAAAAAAQISMDDVSALVTVTIDKEAVAKLKARKPVHQAWGESLEHDPATNAVGGAAQAVGATPQFQQLAAFHHQAETSPLGQRVNQAVTKALRDTMNSIQTGEKPTMVGAHLDNAKIPALEAEWKQAEAAHNQYEVAFKQGYEARGQNLAKTQQIANLKTALEGWKNKHGQEIKGEIDLIKATLDAHTKVFDLPPQH